MFDRCHLGKTSVHDGAPLTACWLLADLISNVVVVMSRYPGTTLPRLPIDRVSFQLSCPGVDHYLPLVVRLSLRDPSIVGERQLFGTNSNTAIR